MELLIAWITIGVSASVIDMNERAESIEYEAEVQMAQLTDEEKAAVLEFDPELDTAPVRQLAKSE